MLVKVKGNCVITIGDVNYMGGQTIYVDSLQGIENKVDVIRDDKPRLKKPSGLSFKGGKSRMISKTSREGAEE